MLRTSSLPRSLPDAARVAIPCEHRTVCQDGRIICTKIVEGDPTISPVLCRTCPFTAVNCSHLRFSLRLTSPSPLIVRFNGLTQIWDDDPPQLLFTQAACEVHVCPIHDPGQCASCSVRQPLSTTRSLPPAPAPTSRRTTHPGKVVPFHSADSDARGATG